METRKLVIVGAGPIGLEAALRATQEGYDVTVLERGSVGAAVRSWGHVKLFTPFSMNSTSAGRLAAHAELDPGDILSGAEFADGYLNPLAECAALKGRVLENHEVQAVSRLTYGKPDRIGSPNRSAARFRILANTPVGQLNFEADILLDCTGFVSLHRHMGAGGIPCPGEHLLADQDYRIPNTAATNRFANRRTLVIGGGYSAATTICALGQLCDPAPNTKIIWVTRGQRVEPMPGVSDDPLSERVRLTNAANTLATSDNNCVDWIPGAFVDRLTRTVEGYVVALLYPDATGEGRVLQLLVDEIVANVGYRPDTRPFEELQIHRCYATEGPIKLAAHLLGETSGDCLQQSSGGAALLKNPEPNFYILGAASYGRDARFLLQTGLKQVSELFDSLETGATV
jgi:thioredoxin reductase